DAPAMSGHFDHSVRSLFFSEKHSGFLPPFLAFGAMRGTQTPLNRSKSTTFANVLTSPSVHHHVHMC
ncbi:hypothetical protein O9431_19320, partial [Proteus mirabilis]|uniref:hypothetical protein n=1 Tax=Proteus mirabilis TaxID=584 RepID=UPI002576F2FC